jgi:hypothetical protein
VALVVTELPVGERRLRDEGADPGVVGFVGEVAELLVDDPQLLAKARRRCPTSASWFSVRLRPNNPMAAILRTPARTGLGVSSIPSGCATKDVVERGRRMTEQREGQSSVGSRRATAQRESLPAGG